MAQIESSRCFETPSMQLGSDMKRIGKYEICGLLGKGGMAKVYKVRMPVIGKIAARPLHNYFERPL